MVIDESIEYNHKLYDHAVFYILLIFSHSLLQKHAFLCFQHYLVNFPILLNLFNILAAADSLASRGVEHKLPSSEHLNLSPLTVTLAWNPPSRETSIKTK